MYNGSRWVRVIQRGVVAAMLVGVLAMPLIVRATHEDLDEDGAGDVHAPPAAAARKLDVGLGYVENTIELGTRDVRETVASIINVAMGLLGVVAVVIILAGGFKWMTAGGETEKVDEAKKLIFAGVIGLAIILAAFAIAQFIINSLVTATANE